MLALPFYASLLLASGLLYRLTSAVWARLVPGKRRRFPLRFVQVDLCLFLPYVVSAYAETWWQTHLGEHAGKAEFAQLDWGSFELGVFFWAWLSLFAAALGLLVVWAFRGAGRAGGERRPRASGR